MFGSIGLPELVTLIFLAAVTWSILRGRSMSAKDRYCQHCGAIGPARKHTKGSFVLEVVLWFCLLIPGIIYSVWRLTSREWVCGTCGVPNTIPIDSPIAKAALSRLDTPR